MYTGNIKKGKELMIFVKSGTGSTATYKAVAFATSHTLNISTDVVEISSKDHGKYPSKMIDKVQWEATTENLYTDESYQALFDLVKNETKVEIVFGESGNEPVACETEGGSTASTNATPKNSGTFLKGTAIISSLDLNASDGDNATFSATFSGCGELTKGSL